MLQIHVGEARKGGEMGCRKAAPKVHAVQSEVGEVLEKVGPVQGRSVVQEKEGLENVIVRVFGSGKDLTVWWWI